MGDNDTADIKNNTFLSKISYPNDATHDTISIATNDATNDAISIEISDIDNYTKYQQSPITTQQQLYKQSIDLQYQYNILQNNYADTVKAYNNLLADNEHKKMIYKILQDNYDNLLDDKENIENDYKDIEIDNKIIKNKLDKTDKKLSTTNKDLQFCKEIYNDDLVKKNDQLQKLQEKINVLEKDKEIYNNNKKDLVIQEEKNKVKFNQKIDIKLQQIIICNEIDKQNKALEDSHKSPSMQQRPVTQLVLQRNAEILAANFNKTWSTDERDIILRKKNVTLRAYVQEKLYDADKLHEETIDAIKKFWEKNQSLKYLQIEGVIFNGKDHELSIFENIITNL